MKVFSHCFLGTSEKKSIHEYIEKIQQYYLLHIRPYTTHQPVNDVYVSELRQLGYCLIFIDGLVYIRPCDSFTQVLAISHSMSSETDSGGRGGRQHWCSSSSVTNRVHQLSVWVTSKDILAYSNGKCVILYIPPLSGINYIIYHHIFCLHTKLQKMQLSSIHTITFCQNSNNFFQQYYM